MNRDRPPRRTGWPGEPLGIGDGSEGSSPAESLEHPGHVGRRGHLEAESFSRDRMVEFKGGSVESLPLEQGGAWWEAEPCRLDDRPPAVEAVAEHRSPYRGKVHPNLVGAAGAGRHLDKRRRAKPLRTS